MNRLAELATRLTPAQLREVEDFAEFLLAKRQRRQPGPDAFIDLDSLAGMLPDLALERTSVELAHEAQEARAQKYMK